MKRTIALLAMAGAVVLVAGCGSSSPGTAAPASTSVAVSSSDTAVTSSSDTAATSSSDDSSSSDTSSSESSSSEESTTTIGDSSGGLDDQSTKWFDTFCTGVAPLADLTNLGSETGSDPKASQAKFVDVFTKAGAAFSSTGVALKDVPPPTFAGGSDFAAKAVPALGILGSAFTDAAKKLAAVDVAKDPSGLATALSGLSSSMTQVSGLSNLDFTPATKAAIAAIPSCKKIPGIGG